MLLLSQGSCFIQSLHFSYEASRVQFLCIRPDDVVFCPEALQSATSVWTTRTFHLDAHQYLEASNSWSLHLSKRNGKSSGHSSKFEKIPVFQWIRPDDVTIPSGRHSVFDKLRVSASRHSYGKTEATVRKMCDPVRTMSSIRQVVHIKFNRPDASQHGPNALASDIEIAYIKSTVRTTIPPVRTSEAFIWKLLAAEMWPSGQQGTTVQTRLKNRKEFQQNSREVNRTVVHPNGPWVPSGQRLCFIKPDSHLNPQPISRGPQAWERQEFCIEFH
jgi:hypothetical protein